jgi:hypothetical protein
MLPVARKSDKLPAIMVSVALTALASPAPEVKQASLPPKNTPPPEPPITLGGRNQWSTVTGPATGIVLGLPERLLTQSRDTAHGTL